MMRIKYVGLDGCTRVAQANRVKFLAEGFKLAERQMEWDNNLEGPLLVVHVYRSKGGKRLVMKLPERYNIDAAQTQMLEMGWLDLSEIPVQMENLY